MRSFAGLPPEQFESERQKINLIDIKKTISAWANDNLSPWLVSGTVLLIFIIGVTSLPGRVARVDAWIQPYKDYVVFVLALFLVIVYDRHENRVRREIVRTREEFAMLVANQTILAQALSDQDAVRYIADKMPVFNKQLDEVAALRANIQCTNLPDWEAQDGYGNFRRAWTRMSEKISELRSFAQETYGIQWPDKVDGTPIAPPDYTGVPEALHESLATVTTQYEMVRRAHGQVVADLEARSVAAVERIRNRLARGAPWP